MADIVIRNPIRERLAAGGVAIGVGVRALRGVEVAQLMKTAGYDWLFIDLEHGATTIDQACQIAQAALAVGIAPVVRIAAGELAPGARCLDNGALGIVVPHVDTAEQARAIASAYRYPPAGTRSVAGLLPQLGFAAVPLAEATRALDAATIVIAMLETPRAIENAAAIAAVPGIDALHVGCSDLSLEMGIPGRLDDPRLAVALERVVAACRAEGKIPSLGGVRSEALLGRYLGLGMRMATVAGDLELLLAAASQRAAFVRGLARAG